MRGLAALCAAQSRLTRSQAKRPPVVEPVEVPPVLEVAP
jgi:hypothetical protein